MDDTLSICTSMDVLGLTLVTFILRCAWDAIHNAGWVNPHFRLTFPAPDILASVYFLAPIRYCPGLWAALCSPSPPTLAWFKALPAAVPRDVWGVYVVILEKAGCIAQIYVGSGTAFDKGVLYRIRSYYKRELLPKNVRKALKAGYKITHTKE